MMDATTLQSGMGAEPFNVQGDELFAEMIWLDSKQNCETGQEEMIAVLEGELQLVSEEDCYQLMQGQGALIPANAPRTLIPQAPSLVYRVRRR